MSGDKYTLTNKTITIRGRVLYRIKALRSFGDVRQGSLGGFIESEDNLSHNGKCWIYNNACVFENAFLNENAVIYDNAMMYGDARVRGNVSLREDAHIFDSARIYGFARIGGTAQICGRVHFYKNSTYNNFILKTGIWNRLLLMRLKLNNRDTLGIWCMISTTLQKVELE